MSEVVNVYGLTELRDALLRKIPIEMQGKVLQEALVAGADPIVVKAQSLAPVKSGALRKAIRSWRDAGDSKPTYEVRSVGITHKVWYGRLVEFGRGVVVARKGSTLGNDQHGFFGKVVRAVPPRPFLRPAFESAKTESLKEIVKALADSIEKAATKAKWHITGGL